MNTLPENKINLYRKLIIVVSIIIPVVVGVLFKVKIDGDLGFLPPIYAGFNGATALLLLAALWAVKNGKISLHRLLVRLSLLLSLLFLICYVAYHMTSDPTQYEGKYALFYYIILISHILLSMIVIPMVLFGYLNAWAGNIEKHKRIVRWAYPIWLYVAVTGVLVYWMIAPFY